MAFSVFTSHHDTLSNSDKHLSELPGDIGDRSTYAERLSQEKLLTQKPWRDTSSVQRAERPLLDISHPLGMELLR